MRQICYHAYSKGEKFYPEDITKRDLVATAFAGMTPEEFREYVVDFADNNEAVGFSGMTYGQSFYKPMIEVIDYLKANDFDVWMVSACEREVVRALMERYGIPYDHVIATDVPYVASGKGDEPADEYNMYKDEEILLGAPLDDVECGQSAKPAAIAREIGKRPVLAFGNSSGDYSMLNYAEGNTVYNGMGFFVVCDDTEREYGSAEKATEYYDIAKDQGWTAVSMANDWKTIYGDDVRKTGLPWADPAADLIIHDVNQEIPGLIAEGEADVMITETMEAGFYVGQDDRLAAPLIYEPFTRAQLGVLMPKGNEELLEYVNSFLEKEKRSGRLDELADEYIYRYIDIDEEEELDEAA